LSRKVQFGGKTWNERASLALNQYRTASCAWEEFKIKPNYLFGSTPNSPFLEHGCRRMVA
jgi:hypothetical protein